MTLDGPVIVVGWNATKQPGVINAKFTQQCMRPIDTGSSMRRVFMQGHESFGTPFDIRVAWVIMTETALSSLGLTKCSPFPSAWGARIVACEFVEGEPIPKEYEELYNKATHFYPKSWAGGVQQPKVSPITGKPVMHKGLPVYRDNHLVIGDMCKKDFLKTSD